MSTFVICRGLPGSGKTTKAVAWVAEDVAKRARVNRDDLRKMLHEGEYIGRATEDQVVAAELAAIDALLRMGIDVVCDDTNIPEQKFERLVAAAVAVDAHLIIWDLRDVPLDVCMRRDLLRERPVGRQAISEMAALMAHER